MLKIPTVPELLHTQTHIVVLWFK